MPIQDRSLHLAALKLLIARSKAKQTKKETRKRSHRFRHGGFHPRPRAGDMGADKRIEKWRFQSSESEWWGKYIDDAKTYDECSAEGKAFAELFIVPRIVYEDLYRTTERVAGYKDTKLPIEKQRWVRFSDKDRGGGSGRGPHSQPLRIKLLAVLMRIRGTKFRVIAEMAKVGPTCLERFYYAWVAWYADTQFPRHVRWPSTAAEIQTAMDKYEKAGMPGAICGTDGVHVLWHGCPASMLHLCKGKERVPTLMFNVSCLLTNETIAVYGPDYGGRNDKTAARLDTFMQAVHRGEIYADVQRTIYGENGQKGVVLKGAHIIVDNGYHPWPTLIPPVTSGSDTWKQLFAERVESVRKPSSETRFGRLKKRFGALREPFFEEEMCKVGDVVRCCLAIDNVLLRHWNLHTIGEHDSDWLHVDANVDSRRAALQVEVHIATQALTTWHPTTPRGDPTCNPTRTPLRDLGRNASLSKQQTHPLATIPSRSATVGRLRACVCS